MITPWAQSTSELYRSSGRRLWAKLMPSFADSGVLGSQHDWFPQPYSRFSRPKVHGILVKYRRCSSFKMCLVLFGSARSRGKSYWWNLKVFDQLRCCQAIAPPDLHRSLKGPLRGQWYCRWCEGSGAWLDLHWAQAVFLWWYQKAPGAVRQSALRSDSHVTFHAKFICFEGEEGEVWNLFESPS
jgi:hypothetical protein